MVKKTYKPKGKPKQKQGWNLHKEKKDSPCLHCLNYMKCPRPSAGLGRITMCLEYRPKKIII